MSYYSNELRVNAVKHRLELEMDAGIAFIDYKLVHNKLFLIHTEVPEELEGKGIGNAIVQKALMYASENNLKVVPICPFVQSFLKKHKEWDDIVVSDHGTSNYK
jgi:predicted GNAT family acetyltransferase